MDPVVDELSVSVLVNESDLIDTGDRKSEGLRSVEFANDVEMDGRECRREPLERSFVAFRGTIGCFPAALALSTMGGRDDVVDMLSSVSSDSDSTAFDVRSGMGETVLSCVRPRVVVAVGVASLDGGCTITFAGCGLIRLFNTGRFEVFVGSRNEFLFADGTFVEKDRSKPVRAVLPDEGMSLSLLPSSSDSGGETNRAVGFGPPVSGLLAFFRIGCDGGGFDALEDKLLMDASLDFIRGGSGRCCVSSRP